MRSSGGARDQARCEHPVRKLAMQPSEMAAVVVQLFPGWVVRVLYDPRANGCRELAEVKPAIACGLSLHVVIAAERARAPGEIEVVATAVKHVQPVIDVRERRGQVVGRRDGWPQDDDRSH